VENIFKRFSLWKISSKGRKLLMKTISKHWLKLATLGVLILGPFALNAALAQKSGPVFDKCLQDNSLATWVLFNSETGDGIFDACNGTHFSGRGIVTRSGCLLKYALDVGSFKLRATVDTCNQSGSATVRDSQTSALLFTITDDRLKGNTCVCAGSETVLSLAVDQ